MHRLIRLLVAAIAALALLTTPLPAPAAPAHDTAPKPRVVAEEQVGPRLVDLTIDSPALGRTAKVRLLTPDGWQHRRPGKRWPVMYLLHGCCDSYESWTRSTDVEELSALRNVLVVMPEGGAVGWYSDWWNYGNGGAPRWETFHLRELRSVLERGYGAGSRRVVAGLSMGGAGALTYTARHPGLFRAAASYSGVVHPLQEGWPEGFFGLLQSNGVDPLALWGDPVAQRRIWAAHDPYYLAGRLKHTPLFVSAGDGTAGPFDPPGTVDQLEAVLSVQNQALVGRLRAIGAKRLQVDLYGPGTHSWPYWERELHRSLPLLLGALRA